MSFLLRQKNKYNCCQKYKKEKNKQGNYDGITFFPYLIHFHNFLAHNFAEIIALLYALFYFPQWIQALNEAVSFDMHRKLCCFFRVSIL